MVVGSMGKKKTTLITDMCLSQEAMLRDKAFERLLANDMKFPRFPWILFENALKEALRKHRIYNLATCKRYVRLLAFCFDKSSKKRLAAVPCSEEESATVEWSRLKNDAYISKTITSPDYVEKIFEIMNWDRTCRYKALGRLAQTERGLALIFDLQEAIMFAPKPVEYIDKITGQTKKRQVKYYPDEYKYKIGKSYNDYVAFQQQSLFENLEEYTETTQGSTIQENGGSNDQSRNE